MLFQVLSGESLVADLAYVRIKKVEDPKIHIRNRCKLRKSLRSRFMFFDLFK